MLTNYWILLESVASQNIIPSLSQLTAFLFCHFYDLIDERSNASRRGITHKLIRSL